MGVKLDWDIESEQGKHKQHKEDFKNRSQRYLGFLRLIAVIVVFLAVVALAVYIIIQRLTQVDNQLKDLLAETSQAEVAALRIGDYESYINIQRSASDEWLITQDGVFQNYQQLKVSGDVVLTGNVVDVTIDGQRGRVQVEEIINGTPYIQTWFYWRYPEPDGWRHVPIDRTFWGDSATIESERFIIRFRELDTPVAESMAAEFERWFEDTCMYIDCTNLPLFSVDILTDSLSEPQWAINEGNAWQMVVSSPYLDRARADKPFDTTMQIAVATLLAERIVEFATPAGEPVYPSDAVFLQSGTVAWIVGRFVQLNPQAYLIESLATNYGVEAVGHLLSTLQPTSDMSILSAITGSPSLGDANLDWRDFIEWRLNTEISLIERQDVANWQALYDFRDAGVQQIAETRFTVSPAGQIVQVREMNRTTASAGSAQLQVRVVVTTGTEQREEIILFNLVNNIWKRAS